SHFSFLLFLPIVNRSIEFLMADDHNRRDGIFPMQNPLAPPENQDPPPVGQLPAAFYTPMIRNAHQLAQFNQQQSQLGALCLAQLPPQMNLLDPSLQLPPQVRSGLLQLAVAMEQQKQQQQREATNLRQPQNPVIPPPPFVGPTHLQERQSVIMPFGQPLQANILQQMVPNNQQATLQQLQQAAAQHPPPNQILPLQQELPPNQPAPFDERCVRPSLFVHSNSQPVALPPRPPPTQQEMSAMLHQYKLQHLEHVRQRLQHLRQPNLQPQQQNLLPLDPNWELVQYVDHLMTQNVQLEHELRLLRLRQPQIASRRRNRPINEEFVDNDWLRQQSQEVYDAINECVKQNNKLKKKAENEETAKKVLYVALADVLLAHNEVSNLRPPSFPIQNQVDGREPVPDMMVKFRAGIKELKKKKQYLPSPIIAHSLAHEAMTIIFGAGFTYDLYTAVLGRIRADLQQSQQLQQISPAAPTLPQLQQRQQNALPSNQPSDSSSNQDNVVQQQAIVAAQNELQMQGGQQNALSSVRNAPGLSLKRENKEMGGNNSDGSATAQKKIIQGGIID
ncbi:hypothetical protein PFISCL1PPCAC_14459, partial [Pristionchus fissidentatus]